MKREYALWAVVLYIAIMSTLAVDSLDAWPW